MTIRRAVACVLLTLGVMLGFYPSTTAHADARSSIVNILAEVNTDAGGTIPVPGVIFRITEPDGNTEDVGPTDNTGHAQSGYISAGSISIVQINTDKATVFFQPISFVLEPGVFQPVSPKQIDTTPTPFVTPTPSVTPSSPAPSQTSTPSTTTSGPLSSSTPVPSSTQTNTTSPTSTVPGPTSTTTAPVTIRPTVGPTTTQKPHNGAQTGDEMKTNRPFLAFLAGAGAAILVVVLFRRLRNGEE